jgi:hypothetical protein
MRLAHGPGMFGEIVPPLVLLFSHNHTVTVIAAVFMIAYHLFIISTFPLAVPLEWNVVFMYLTAFLFLGFPAQHGYGLENMGAPLLIATVAGLLFFPMLGNLRPDLVSFLPSMRQYAGNWLPNGPIQTEVDWRLTGYERVSYRRQAAPAAGEPAAAQGAATGKGRSVPEPPLGV